MKALLECYVFDVYPKRKPKEFIDFSKFQSNKSFNNLFEEYIKDFDDKPEIYEHIKKGINLISTDLLHNSNKRTISGWIECGDYGSTSILRKGKSAKASYIQAKDEVTYKPFYFLLYVPKQGQFGILLLQRRGLYSAFSPFRNHYRTYFENKYPDTSLRMQQFISKTFIKKYIEEGEILELNLYKDFKSNDKADL